MTPAAPEIQERTLASLIQRRLGSVLYARRSLPPNPQRTMGVGLVGLGNVAKWLYLPRLQKPGSGFQLKAVLDVRQEVCEEVGRSCGARPARSLAELIAEPGVEAVLVCTPTPLHCEPVMEALKAGKHVLCEKPLARSFDEARALHEAAGRAGTVTMVNFSYRFRADLRFAGEIVRSGALGRLHQIWGSVSQGGWFDEQGRPSAQRGDAAPWKFRQDGGVVLDLGPHLLDLCRCWLGEVAEVHAWTESLGSTEERSEAACGISLRFINGCRGHLLTSRLATGSGEQTLLEVTGSKGAIRLNAAGITLWTREMPRWRRLLIPQNPPDFLRTFHNAISGSTEPLPTFEDGVRNNQLIDAVHLSAQRGRSVEIPVNDRHASP